VIVSVQTSSARAALGLEAQRKAVFDYWTVAPVCSSVLLTRARFGTPKQSFVSEKQARGPGHARELASGFPLPNIR
jgi:hypothetical protein